MPLSPDDLGHRVTVRRRLTAAEPRGPALGDVVGVLEHLDDHELRVRRRDGGVVTVDPRLVVAARRVTGRARAGRSMADDEVRDLEAVAAQGWSALEREWLDGREGGWLLRASGGFTGRANSVLPLAVPGRPVTEAVAAAEAWYAGRGLPLRFQVPLPLAADLDPVLADHGLARRDPVLVLTAALDEVEVRCGERDVDARVVVDPRPDADWLGAYHYRGGELPPVARQVLEHAPPGTTLGFASVRDGPRVLAVARGSVVAGWLGVTAVEVVPEARRQGLATAVMRALSRWARGHAADRTYLQVAADNQAGRALYGMLGLRLHHRYHYRDGRVAA